MSVCDCGRSTNDGRSLCDRCTALVTFGLTRDATPSEIKDAYRVMAKVWHPDRFQGDERLRLKAEEKLKEINSAYQLLTTTPAEEPHRPPSGPPPPPPQEPRQTATADTTQIPHARPITNNFYYAFRLKQRAARLRIALIVLVLVAGAAWIVQRYGRTIAYELDVPYPGDTSTAVRKNDTASDSSKRAVASTPASGGSSATNNSKAAHPRTTAAASQGPSLLVYPADDPRVAYFTIGSAKSDVVKVQGAPTRIAGNTFTYGLSEVYFQGGRVQSWHSDPSAPLKARMPE